MSSFWARDAELVQVILLEAGAKIMSRRFAIFTIHFQYWISQQTLEVHLCGGTITAPSSHKYWNRLSSTCEPCQRGPRLKCTTDRSFEQRRCNNATGMQKEWVDAQLWSPEDRRCSGHSQSLGRRWLPQTGKRIKSLFSWQGEKLGLHLSQKLHASRAVGIWFICRDNLFAATGQWDTLQILPVDLDVLCNRWLL